jgi:N-acetylglutamate synthase-like GNAT family acetyltransferase
MATKEILNVKIIPFNEKYTTDFTQLNFEWLEKYFYIEDYDRKVLTNPKKYILDKGGYIFFALVNETVVGTVALIKREKSVFELSKMAVTSNYKGLHIGQKLMYKCIGFAGNNNIKRLFLDSNTILTPAITLYKKVGFKEIPVPKNTPYERCNIRMELYI